jgi:transcriptional regulator with XRE-family HTH domain
VLADNLRIYRAHARLDQADVAEAMRKMGHPTISRAAIGEVEAARRNTTVDELCSLSVALGVAPPMLLDPLGPSEPDWSGIDIGGSKAINPGVASLWAYGEARVRPDFRVEPIRHQRHDYAEGALKAISDRWGENPEPIVMAEIGPRGGGRRKRTR